LSESLDLLASLVLEDGQRWGEVALPFQWEDARAVLDRDGPPFSFLTRSRGSSKTTDLAACAVAAMLTQAPRGAKLYAAASDRDQARLLLDSIEGFHARTPGLGLEIGAWRVGVPRSKVTLDALAADAPSAYGLRPYLLVVDELASWPETPSARRLWEALSSACAKLPDSRLAVLTTAGSPSHFAAKVRDHAAEDPLWRLHERPGVAPWLDPRRVEEQRRRLPESSFRRLFLNEWTSAEDSLASAEQLRACVTLDGPQPPRPGRRYWIGLDLGIRSDATAAAILHAEPLSRHEHARGDVTIGVRVVLDRLQVWQGTRAAPVSLTEVEDWIVHASRLYEHARVRFDPWQMLGVAERLRHRGVRTEEFSFSSASVGRLASTLHLLIREGKLALYDDEELLDELARVRLKETSAGLLRLDHVEGEHDDRATAIALAATKLVVEPGAPTRDPVMGGAVDRWTFAGLPHGDELLRDGRYIAASYGQSW
jgi:phage terminase large subunit-like protein